NVLVVVEMALAFMLLVGSGLLVRSFFRMMNVELGFDATNVLTMQLPIASDRFASPSALTQYVRELEARIGVVPGVRGVAGGAAARGLEQRHAVPDCRSRSHQSCKPALVRSQDGQPRLPPDSGDARH